jgi:hypothetical protein
MLKTNMWFSRLWNRWAHSKSLPEYDIIPSPDTMDTYITIRSGKYRGVSVQYGRVSLKEPSESGGFLTVKFNYEILANKRKVSIDKDEFIKVAGDILVDLIDNEKGLLEKTPLGIDEYAK